MSRPSIFILMCAVVAILAASPVCAYQGSGAVALPSSRQTGDDEGDKAQAAPKNAGSIDGLVTAVDYKLGHITVKAAATQYDVIVSPSTEFRGHNNKFHTIADIQKGAHVEVLMSQQAGTYTAQIIRFL